MLKRHETDGKSRKGRFVRLAWSEDWHEKTPWSLSGTPMPYIGSRSIDNHVVMITIGPLAIVIVDLDT